jgi:hypothetical protein
MGEISVSNAAQITGNCALYHVAAKLSRLAWAVSMTTRNARGAYMFAINTNESVLHPIQSKGLSKRSAVPLGTSLERLRSRWWVINSRSLIRRTCLLCDDLG